MVKDSSSIDQKIKATQDQLRYAKITQDQSVSEDEKNRMQKLIKKVS